MAAMVLYDGDCGFCTRCARWLEVRAAHLDVVSWQTVDLGAIGLTEADARRAAYWVEGSAVEGAERAVGRSLVACGGGYALLGRALLLPGVRRVAALGYRFVARHRGRLPGPARIRT